MRRRKGRTVVLSLMVFFVLSTRPGAQQRHALGSLTAAAGDHDPRVRRRHELLDAARAELAVAPHHDDVAHFRAGASGSGCSVTA